MGGACAVPSIDVRAQESSSSFVLHRSKNCSSSGVKNFFVLAWEFSVDDPYGRVEGCWTWEARLRRLPSSSDVELRPLKIVLRPTLRVLHR